MLTPSLSLVLQVWSLVHFRAGGRIVSWESVSPNDISATHIMEHVRPHRALDLSGGMCVSDDLIRTVAQTCTGLTSLNLDGCVNVTNTGLEVMASNCPRLTLLDVQSCTGLTDDAMRAVAQKCRCLNLAFHRCRYASCCSTLILSQSHHFTCGKLLQSVRRRHPGCRTEVCQLDSDQRVSEQGDGCNHPSVDTGCPKITSLNISYSRRVTFFSMLWIANAYSRQCRRLTQEAVRTVTYKCHQLTHLSPRQVQTGDG